MRGRTVSRRWALAAAWVVRPSGAGKLLLLADVHLDAAYDPSRGPTCRCNAKFDDALGTCKLAAFSSSSSSGSGSSRRGSSGSGSGATTAETTAWGQFGCDSPYALVASAFAAAAAALPAPDVLVFAGDFMSHASASEADTLAGVGSVATALATAFPRLDAGGRPFAVALGNADLFDDYHLDFSTDRAASNSYLERVGRVWQRSGGATPSLGLGLNAAANATLRAGGFYASTPVLGQCRTT
jgi:3',5'-cyclic AMP phosphodiesterase CpdA